MYKLLKPIHGGLGVLIQEVEGHIKQTGMEAVRSLKGDNVSQSGDPPTPPPPSKFMTCNLVTGPMAFYYTKKRTDVLCNPFSVVHVGNMQQACGEVVH